MKSADRVGAILLLTFAVFVIAKARELAYWHQHAPGPGFLPFWLGVLLGAASLALLAGTFRGRAPDEPWLPDRPSAVRLAVVVALSIGAAALMWLVGLVLAAGAFMAATLAYLRPGRAGANWTIAVLTPIVIWLVFVKWLSVPLPAGPLGF